ncbi:MAG: ATP-binding protein [Conexibacter sp.]|nr:ATP-binding protein [Conexibacter sp.]
MPQDDEAVAPTINLDEGGTLARVRHVAVDGAVWIEFRNGNVATITGSGPIATAGDVILISPAADRFQVVPHELWPEERRIGVVRLKQADFTLIETDLSIRMTTTNGCNYKVGNTVEWAESRGVVRVLHEFPVTSREHETPTDDLVAGFARHPDPDGLDFDAFVGQPDVVARARDLVETTINDRASFDEIGTPPIKGVLFTGPPGTGKTMLAQIIANQAGAAFYEIRGPEIFSKWVGDSELVLRRLFDHARSQPKAVIFFDEIDSVAPRRDTDSHEVSRRVVATLLTAMDGFTRTQNVVVIATTNRRDDIDPALLRPGRFDWEVQFSLPNERAREQLLIAEAQRLSVAGDLPHGVIAGRTAGWSPADLAVIWKEAALLAVKDGRSVISAEDYLGAYQRRARQRSDTAAATREATASTRAEP